MTSPGLIAAHAVSTYVEKIDVDDHERAKLFADMLIDDRRHCQSNFYAARSRTGVRWSLAVFAHELLPRSAGFDAENRLYLFALTMPP